MNDFSDPLGAAGVSPPPEPAADGPEALRQEAIAALPEICTLLRRKTGHDFSRYKQSTLGRRVSRRLLISRLESVDEYLKQLNHDPREIENLFNDLLIGVTQFFRDPEAFESLASAVIPQLFKRSTNNGPIRVWVSGCATGEEAYSIAILFAEERAKIGSAAPGAIVFATDLDGASLEVARKAQYSAQSVEQISPARLDKFFRRDGELYEVRKEIREMCVFSPHNVVKDPPFSRLDLISCRNLLIYFESDLQKRLLPLFHFALNPSGFLFLGPSENVAIRSELFHAVDKKNRIFQRKPALLKTPLYPPGADRFSATPMPSITPPAIPPSKDHNTTRTIERVLLEEYAPASVVINEQGEALFFSGHTGRFLEHQAGAPTTRLVDMARANLRLELRTALQRAFSTGQEIIRRNIPVRVGRNDQHIDLIVRPLLEVGREAGLFIVVFQEIAQPAAPPTGGELPEHSDQAVIKQLEGELRTTREDLQTTVEELETSNEELKSANEELLSMNEELQSTNEELQTSKEEIQSVNDELQRKVEELDAANNDLQNFLDSSQVPTLFLDAQLRVRKFTPALSQICRLTADDVGRNLFQAEPRCIHPELSNDIQEVLRTGQPHERQIAVDHSARWHLMRVAPYRGIDGSVQGVVITFPDITAVKRGQEQSALLAAIIDGSQDGVIGKTLDGIITSWNEAATKMYGYTAAEAIGKPISIIIPPNRLDELPLLYARIKRGETIKSFETERVARDGKILAIALTLSPIRDDQGEIIGVSGIDRNITESKLAHERQARLAAIVDSSDDAIIGKTLDGTITSWNNGAQRIFGYTPEEMVGQSIMTLIPSDRRQEELDILARLRSGRSVEHYETVRLRKDGQSIDISLTSSPIRNSQGVVIGASKIARDISEQRRAQAALTEARERLQRHAEELEVLVAQRTASLEETIESLEGVCYTIAHDLRAPLRAVQSFTQVLLDEYGVKFDDEGRQFAERIVAAASRMDQLINDLLAYAKLTHSQLPTEPLDLNEHTRRVVEHLGPLIAAQHGEVSVRPLPTVVANQTVLGQVFANLITNALKFVPPGTKPKIEIGAEKANNSTAHIYIQDNGIGIPNEHRERVFGLFQRLHHEEYPGTGVGLAIVRKGLERMHGDVTIDPSSKVGARFLLSLPLAPKK